MANWEDLPEFFIHQIQSFLYEKDQKTFFRTSLVSRSWRHAWSTHPNLTFDQSRLPSLKSKRMFEKLVDDTLSRYARNNLRIKFFRLFTIKNLEYHRFSKLQSWLETVRRNGVEELCLLNHPYMSFVPATVFATKTLQTLTLYRCELRVYDTEKIGCRSLKNVTLIEVDTDECTLKNFMSSCPLIETLAMCRCDGFKKICLAGIHSLRSFKYESLTKNFPVKLIDESDIPLINLHSFRSLTCLKLCKVGITDEDLGNFGTMFPFLDDLLLELCGLLERIKVAFGLLRRLTIYYCGNIKEVTIDAPKLRILHYHVVNFPIFVLKNVCEGQLEFACIKDEENRSLDIGWFYWLSQVIQKSRLCDVSVVVSGKIEVIDNKDLEILRAISFPPKENVKLFSLEMPNPTFVACAVEAMDALFTICRPKYISLGCYATRQVFLELLLIKLEERKTPSCCEFVEYKCWRHYLQDVTIGCWKPKDEERVKDCDEDGWRQIADSCESVAEGSVTLDRFLNIGIKLEWVS